jgi:oligopeptide/dipeptide ABC transporter ATP-binding protein
MEFSGGMRQRAAIGMGLMAEPVLIVADEPTTALDVTVQRDVLVLLRQVRDERGAGVLFVSHDIAVIAEIATRVLVMYGGRIVEDLPVTALQDAAHPYTRALVASIPDMTTDRGRPLATIPGRPPDPGALPVGCSFAARCGFADEQCRASRPPLIVQDGQRIACWHPRTAGSRA